MALAEERRQMDRRYSVSTLLQPRAEGLNLVPDERHLPTDMDPLDRALGGGFVLNDLVLLGGRPGVGKTIATLQWARGIARSGAKAVMASFEHDEQTLLGRLIALEMGMLEVKTADTTMEALVAGVLDGGFGPGSEIGRHPLVRAALSQIETYSEDIVLLPASKLRIDLDGLEDLFKSVDADRKALVVDYIQKVPVAGTTTSWDTTGARIVAERLKELSLSEHAVVIAVSALGQDGLRSRRARVQHLQSAAALSYEADVVIMMNEKALATSRVHLAYDTTKAKEFDRRVVFSIEKNRSGRPGLDLEFIKDFRQFRFLPTGGFVAETLVDGVVDNS